MRLFMFQAITTLDTFIQKGVDHAVFAVMRTAGWRKSFVHYLLCSIGLAGLIGDMSSRISDPLTKALALASCLFILLGNEAIRRRAERSEDAGMAGWLPPGSLNFLKFMWATWMVPDAYRGWWFAVAVDVVMLVSQYVANSPNTPPPKEKRETVMSAVGAES